jgi:hypothetical protein
MERSIGKMGAKNQKQHPKGVKYDEVNPHTL